MRRLLLLVTVLLVAMVVAPSPRPAVAQDTGGLTLTLTPNVKKAKIGDIVEFTVLVENTGGETLPGVVVSIGLPDALDARAVYCPGDTFDTVISCQVGVLAPGENGPGETAEVQFYVQVGSRTANGVVTAQAVDIASNLLATAEIAPIKVVGSPKLR